MAYGVMIYVAPSTIFYSIIPGTEGSPSPTSLSNDTTFNDLTVMCIERCQPLFLKLI